MSNLAAWHEIVMSEDLAHLKNILHKDCTFYSPIIFKPQKGRKKTAIYLKMAAKVLKSGGFEYVKEVDSGSHSVLEFQAEIDGIQINGVDIISWNDDGEITEFKVMLRPFRAIEKLGEKMREEIGQLGMMDKLLLAK